MRSQIKQICEPASDAAEGADVQHHIRSGRSSRDEKR